MLSKLSQESKKWKKLESDQCWEKDQLVLVGKNQSECLKYWQGELKMQLIMVVFWWWGTINLLIGAILTENQWLWFLTFAFLLVGSFWSYYGWLCLSKMKELELQWQKTQKKIEEQSKQNLGQKVFLEMWKIFKTALIKKIKSKDENGK